MKVKEIMSGPVIRIHDKENVAVAARTLTHLISALCLSAAVMESSAEF